MNKPAWMAAVAIAFAILSAGSAPAGNIVNEWATVKAPPAPALKAVSVDPKETALLLLDFQAPNCPPKPRCMESLPAMKKLLGEARAKGMLVVYSTAGRSTAKDIMADLAPAAGDPIVHSNADKFAGTDLEKILKDKNIRTVIVTGTAAHGAVLYTASTAARRAFKVLVPVDGMSSEEPFYEQAVAWLLAHGTGPIGTNVALTATDMIKF